MYVEYGIDDWSLHFGARILENLEWTESDERFQWIVGEL